LRRHRPVLDQAESKDADVEGKRLVVITDDERHKTES
jgi:hypothetical protein